MNKQAPVPTQAEIEETHFDFSQPVSIPGDSDNAPGEGVEFQVLERGSDTHIAFLEQALEDLTETLAELKAARHNQPG